ncbi:MAG: hypothetical protein QM607_06700 [Microbacterium sp.]
MAKLKWFVVGTAAGFVIAHFVSKSERGAEVFASIDAGISSFADGIANAYRDEEARRGITA